MVSTMTTRNAGRRTAATRGGGTSEQDGEKVRGQEIRQEVVGMAKGMAEGNVRTMNNERGGCLYKEFIACNLKEYDGKGSVIVYTCWIEKMESVQYMSGCGENQMVKYIAGSLIAGHAAYSNRFHELARLVPYFVTLENKRIKRYIYGLALPIRVMVAATEPTTIQSVVLKAGMLTDEAINNGALKIIYENRGNNGEPSWYGNARDDNKLSRTGRAFATTTNLVRKEYTDNAPKCTNCNYHHQPELDPVANPKKVRPIPESSRQATCSFFSFSSFASANPRTTRLELN
ncbi:hypothetical protein Tco_1169253 [Tanacetum coccineum]